MTEEEKRKKLLSIYKDDDLVDKDGVSQRQYAEYVDTTGGMHYKSAPTPSTTTHRDYAAYSQAKSYMDLSDKQKAEHQLYNQFQAYQRAVDARKNAQFMSSDKGKATALARNLRKQLKESYKNVYGSDAGFLRWLGSGAQTGLMGFANSAYQTAGMVEDSITNAANKAYWTLNNGNNPDRWMRSYFGDNPNEDDPMYKVYTAYKNAQAARKGAGAFSGVSGDTWMSAEKQLRDRLEQMYRERINDDYLFDPEGGALHQLAERSNELYNWTQEQNQKQLEFQKMGSTGKGWDIANQLVIGTAQALPYAAFGMLGAAGAGGEIGAQLSPQTTGILNKVADTLQSFAKSPDYWLAFTQETGNTYREALDAGASQDTAALTATLVGLINGAIEIGLPGGNGGIQDLPERLIKNGKGSRKAIQEWVESSVSEGKEEILQGIISNLAEKLGYNKAKAWTGNEGVFDVNALAKEGFMGMAVGGILGGGQAVGVNAYNRSVQNKINQQYAATGARFRNKADTIIENALNLPETTEAYKLAQELKSRQSEDLDEEQKSKLYSNEEIGRLYSQTMRDTGIDYNPRADALEAIEDRLKHLGETSDTRETAQLVLEAAERGVLSSVDKSTKLKNSKYGQRVLNEFRDSELIPQYDSEWADKLRLRTAEKAATPELTQAERGARIERLERVVNDDVNPAEKADIDTLAEKYGAQANVFKEAAKAVEGTDIYYFDDAYHTVYQLAKSGLDESTIRKDMKTSWLSPSAFQVAYKAGQAAQTTTSGTRYNPNATLKLNGINYKSLNNKQRASVRALMEIARVTGINIELFDSTTASGALGDEQGSYSNGKIRIDINAGMLDKGDILNVAMLRTASHELTHYIQQNNKDAYKELKDFVFDKLQVTMFSDGKYKDADTWIRAKMDTLKMEDNAKNYDIASDEVIADACEMMLKDSTAFETLAKENPSLARRLLNWLKGLIADIKKAFSGVEAASTEAKAMVDSMEELQKKWDAALVGAVQNTKQTAEVSNDENTQYQTRGSSKDEFDSVDQPVERTKDLIALHNLTEDKLLKSIQLGGFPMPSIAVTRASIPHTNFGDITLVMNRSTVDPLIDRRNTVYSADAWTPIFPEIEYEVNDNVASRISKRYYALANKYGYDFVRPLYAVAVVPEDTLNRNGGEQGVIEKLRNDTGVQNIFLADTTGEPVEDIKKTTTKRLSDQEISQNEFFINRLGEDVINEITPQDGEGIGDARRRWVREHMDALDSAIEDYYRSLAPDLSEEKLAEAIETVLSDTTMSKLLNYVVKARNYLHNGAETSTTENDVAAKDAAIKERVDQKQYEAWLRDLVSGIEKSSGIWNNKDYLTPSGNRRSFASTHYPVTLENIAKAMSGKNGGDTKNVSGFVGIKTLRAATAKKFSSIDEMHEYKGRLQHLTEVEAAQISDELSDKMMSLISDIYATKKHSDYENQFIEIDNIGNMLSEAAELNNKSVDNIRRLFKDRGYGAVTNKTIEQVNELFDEVSAMPVNIFEAKPERAVRFDEVLAAVIPDSISNEVREKLQEVGVETIEYKHGDNEARLNAVNSVEDAQFSRRSAQVKRDAGEKLTESEFYSLYSAHKIYSGNDVEATIKGIRENGFRGDGGMFGHNLMPTYFSYRQDENGNNKPSNISEAKYAPRKGETILLVPKSGAEINKRYDRVKPGYKPAFDYEIVTADYDYQPYYEMYSKAYDTANENVQYSMRYTKDGTRYVKLDGNIFLNEDGTEMSAREAYEKLVGTIIYTEDGDSFEIVKNIPKKQMYDELFKRWPDHDDDINVRTINDKLNKNFVEIGIASQRTTDNITDIADRHNRNSIDSFTTRTVVVADDKRAYSLDLSIARLYDGTNIAYAKKYIREDAAMWQKIEEAERQGNLPAQSTSNEKVSQKGMAVKRGDVKTSADVETESPMVKAMREAGLIDENGDYSQNQLREQISTREALAGALMNITENEAERTRLVKYIDGIEKIETAQARVTELGKQIHDIMFTKGSDRSNLAALQAEKKNLESEIERYDKMLIGLQSTAPMKALRDRALARAKTEAKATARADARALARTARELARMTSRVESFERARERRDTNAVRKSIKGMMEKWNSKLQSDTPARNIPAPFKTAIAELSQALDLTSGRPMSEKAQDKLTKLKAAYDSIMADKDFSILADPVAKQLVDNAIDAINNTPLRQMGREELDTLYDAMKALNKVIFEANRLRDKAYKYDLYQTGKAMMMETNEANAIKWETLRDINTWQLTPERFFAMLGGMKKNSVWETQVAESFKEGTRRALRVERDFYNTFKAFTEAPEMDRLINTNKLIDVGLLGKDGKSVKLTRGMALSLYMHLLADDNRRAILYGGLNIPVFDKYYGGKIASSYATGHENAVGILADMTALADEIYEVEANDSLTDEQKKAEYERIGQEQEQLESEGYDRLDALKNRIYDQMTDFEKKLCETVTAWNDGKSRDYINEVTMEMYGIKRAKVKNYYRIHRDTSFVQTDFEGISKNLNLNNVGWLKDRVKSAAPVLLTDITYEMDNGVKQLATYYGYVKAQTDFTKLYNFKQRGANKSVKDSVKSKFGGGGKAFGVTADQYVENLIGDVVGSRVKPETSLLAVVRRNLPRATLTLNPRVALSQIASVPTAAAEVGWGPMLKGFVRGLPTALSKDAKTRLMNKDEYFFQRYRGDGSMREFADMKSGNNVIDKLWNKADKLTKHVLLNWCQNCDVFATATMWAMAEEWVKANTNLTGEEFDAAVKQKYDDIITKTQPNYTTTERSDLLRDTREIYKLLTMYKTQSNQNYNILWEANARLKKTASDLKNGKNGVTQQDLKEARKRFANAYTALFIGATPVFVMLRALANALLNHMNDYRDDDDEITAVSTLNGLTKAYIQSLSGMFVFGTEFENAVESVVSGKLYYGMSDSAMSAVGNTAESLVKLAQAYAQGKTDNIGGKWAKLAQNALTTLGLPYNSVKTFVEGGKAWMADIERGTFGSFEGAVTRTNSVNYNRLYKALENGDTAKADRIREEIRRNDPDIEDKTIENGLRGVIKGMWEEGAISSSEAVDKLVEYTGKDKDTAYWDVQKWGNKANAEEDEKYTDSNYYRLWQVIDNDGDAETAMSELLEHGKDADQIAQDVRKHIKDAYTNGEITDTQARERMLKYGQHKENKQIVPYTKAEVDKLVNGWVTSNTLGWDYDDKETLYAKGEISKSELKTALVDIGGMTSEKADQRIEIMDWNKEGYAVENDKYDSIIGEYNKKLKSHGISKSIWYNYYIFESKTSGEVDANGKSIPYSKMRKLFEYIGNLNITSEQKMALARTYTDSESSIAKYKTW